MISHAYQSDLGWTAQALPVREPRMKIPRRGRSHTTTKPAAAKGLPGMNVENASPTTNIQAFRAVPSLTKRALITPKIRADIPPQIALSVTIQMRPTRIPQKQFRTNAIVIFCASFILSANRQSRFLHATSAVYRYSSALLKIRLELFNPLVPMHALGIFRRNAPVRNPNSRMADGEPFDNLQVDDRQ